MAALIFVTGVLDIIVGLAGYLFRRVREVETLMPDHDEVKACEEEDGTYSVGEKGDDDGGDGEGGGEMGVEGDAASADRLGDIPDL